MSHSRLRAEKICLNCGSPVPERYCPVCGQENIESRQSVWHLVTHFFSDITHFDGKFFVTVKDLFRKPGFLSREYMAGRRVSYLDPVRMYIFTSAFFFIIFFSVFDVKTMHMKVNFGNGVQKTMTLNDLLARAQTLEDSAEIRAAFAHAKEGQIKAFPDSLKKRDLDAIDNLAGKYHSAAQYDSVQAALPVSMQDGWLIKKFERKKMEIMKRFHKDRSALITEWLSAFLHNFPKMLFLSLPVFALLLKLLYLRRKQFYYVDHGIFSIHLYIFSFLILLVYFFLNRLMSVTGWNWLSWIKIAVVLFPFWYFYKAMRKFYGQKRFKTLVKYCLLFILSVFLQVTLFILFFFFSALEI